MRLTVAFGSALLLPIVLGSAVPLDATRFAPAVRINDNRSPAGVLRSGVLTVRLEVRDGTWRPDGDAGAGIALHAFAEEGHDASIPGPLIRVPEGTEIRATVHNTLSQGTVVVRGLTTRGTSRGIGGASVGSNATDTMSIAPGASREVSFPSGPAGTYHYSAVVVGAPIVDGSTVDAELNGAFVIDPRGTTGPARDRVLVLGFWSRNPDPRGVVSLKEVLRFTINGRSWPNTERLAYARGDTVRFRVVNTSAAVHPMHLHGFYFTVGSRGNGQVDSVYGRDVAPYQVVTERLTPGRTMTLTWVPDRPGNWLFHCHDNFHIARNVPLDGSPLAAEETMHVTNHAMDMMGGLVMGIEVRGDDRVATGARDTNRRHLRLVARVDTGGTAAEPSYGYALDDRPGVRSNAPLIPGPTLLLKRGEPVAITVVNELPEATAVHWHGIELESYFDGVAGFSGQGRHIAPAIAPRDSFIARFTPPRSGTFIYHPHADEVRQQTAGLSGALLVVDDPATYDASHEILVLVTTPRRSTDAPDIVFINGSKSPPARDLRAGERYRIRLINIHTFRPSMVARLVGGADTLAWRPLAKDGMELPVGRSAARPAIQSMGNGETFDFEFVPPHAGLFQLQVSAAVGNLLGALPLRAR